MNKTVLLRLKQIFRQHLGLQLAVIYLFLVVVLTLVLPWLPLAFTPGNLDLANPFLPPFSEGVSGVSKHWLGTDQMGRDVLVNLLYGFQTAFFIAVPVMVFALVLGTLLGSAAGFLGNRKFEISKAAIVVLLFWLLAVFFYCFYLPPIGEIPGSLFSAFGIKFLWLAGISLIAFVFLKLLKTLGFLRKKVPVPVDELVLKIMEVLTSVPRLVLILSFSALAAPGISNVILLLSLTYWAGPARLVRAEVLKIKQLPYVEAAEVGGLMKSQILFRHILPNAAAPLWVAFSFGLSSLLGLEATLSFLGIGLPPETPSWGRMLAGARVNAEAWWLLVFPSIALCFTILAIQTCGNQLQKAFSKV